MTQIQRYRANQSMVTMAANAAAQAARNYAISQYNAGAFAGRKKTYRKGGLRGGRKTVRYNKYAGPSVRVLNTAGTLSKKVANLQEKVKATEATHTRRSIYNSALSVATPSCAYQTFTGNTTGLTEGALSSLRYYDPSNPSVLVTADGTTGSYNRHFLFKNCSTTLDVKNNCQVPVNIRIYSCTPKANTSKTPLEAFTDGIGNQGAPSTNSTLVFPTDSELFRKNWKIEKSVVKILQPGSQLSMSHNLGSWTYDPSNVDEEPELFMKKYKGQCFLIRLHGAIGHDSTAGGNVGFTSAGVDMIMRNTFKIVYDAGTNLEDYSISEDIESANNVSNKPQAAQQQYSI